jgi:hypothetical protein
MPTMRATLVRAKLVSSCQCHPCHDFSLTLASVSNKDGEFIDKMSECQILKAVQRGIRLKTIILLADGFYQTIVTHSAFFGTRPSLGQWFCFATPESEIKIGVY